MDLDPDDCWCDGTRAAVCNDDCQRIHDHRTLLEAARAFRTAHCGDQNEDEYHAAVDALLLVLRSIDQR